MNNSNNPGKKFTKFTPNQKQMSYKYWLTAMIAQGTAAAQFDNSEDFANEVVERANAVLERLKKDKVTGMTEIEDMDVNGNM